jgi:chromosomal replication initiator protein
MEELDKNAIWRDFLESVKITVSPAIFSTWFSQTHLLGISKKKERYLIGIGCPSSFVKNTIESRYFGLIQDSLTNTLGGACDVYFEIKEKPQKDSQKNVSSPLFENRSSNEENVLELVKQSRLRKQYTFENFAVSSSNQMAWAAGEAVCQNPGSAYNPLFIWGGVGVGKTHLMNAVGYDILKRDPEKKVYLCTGEEFTNDIVEGIRNKTTQNFRNKYRKLDVFLIDDIQFIAGKDTVQEEFFHTFNAIVASGGQIILTSDKPPTEIAKLEERLRSRFEAGLIVDISPPDFELRCAITQIKCKEKGIYIPMNVIQLIAGNIDSPRKIEGVLIKIITETNVKKIKDITEEVVKPLLGKRGNEEDSLKKVSTEDVLEAVCKHFSIKKREILGQSRTRILAYPRQILMYLLRTSFNMPLEEVGRAVGGRDHTTVMHAVDKITNLASLNVNTREDISGIKKLLQY